ncbi:MAG TPA: M1 family aminopeptidase, partial [Thermoanaerobaculia bacterium]|nr:M1 family aminopeptidase [Thermoanaerobaculia bacterium]
VPFSNGTTVVRWREGDLNCAEFRLYKPIQFPVVLAGRYQIFSEYRKGVTVRVATYVLADHQAMRRLSSNIFALVDFYQLYLGDFPFKELDLIEINSYGFGIAPAGIIFITKEAFEPLADAKSKFFSKGSNARLAHEVAHTWWGHVGKMSGPESQWLSESTAEYFSAFAMSHLERPSAMDQARREWRRISRRVHDHGSLYLANQLSGYNAGRDRFGLLYGKGPLVLDALRKKLGDREFFTVCRSMLTSSPFHHLYTRQFIGLTNLVKQRDLGPWFGKYLLGTDWP